MRVLESRNVLAMGLVATALACGDGPAAPGDPPPSPPLVFALTTDSLLPRGPLVSEVAIEVPDSTGADSASVLWMTGQLNGPGLVEVVSEVTLENRAVPAAEILSQGGVGYYRSDGELVFRLMFVTFFDPHFQRLFGLTGPDPVEVLDPTAPEHDLRMTWHISEEMSSGFNIHSGEPPPDYLYMDSFVAVLPPLFSPENISDTPPRGTIRVRAFATSTGEEVRITRVGGGALTVRPERTGTNRLDLEVGVFDAAGQPIPNRTVTLAVDGIERTGGHQHGGTMPAGTLTGTVIPTGATGLASVTYRAAVFGGGVEIRGTADGAVEAVDTIQVRVVGLVELADGGTVDTIGVTTTHPDSHWGTPGMVAALLALGDSVQGRFGRGIAVNDMSLPSGGKFDLNNGYGPSGTHGEHRVGTSTDLRTNDFIPSQLKFVKRTWERLGGTVHDETDNPKGPHFHLRFPE